MKYYVGVGPMMDQYTILFVDDQPNILATYRALSKKDTSKREYYFVKDGAEAIEVLWNNKIDVLITDYNMPILDGLQLTAYVEKNFPSTVRVIVSGCMDYELFVDSMKHAHRFISKPATIKELISLLESISFIHSIINDNKIEKELLKITMMPALPDVYRRVCALMEDEENFSLKGIGDIIVEDLGMSSNILKFINSTYFSISEPVLRIDQAVSLLGADIIKMLILRETINSFVSNDEKGVVERVLKHSALVSALVKQILVSEKQPREIVDLGYTIAFLHDVGRLVLNHSFHENYEHINKCINSNHCDIEEMEMKQIGISHSKIAAYLFSLWGLPKEIIIPLMNHHAINALDSSNPIVVAALHVADALEYHLVGSDFKTKSLLISESMVNSLGYGDRIDTWSTVVKEYLSSLKE